MSICQRCSTAFTCGMVDTPGAVEACWCTGLPPLPRDAYPVGEESRCLCPQCLRDLIAQTAEQKNSS